MNSMEVDGSDVESNYSGISNEDFEEPDEESVPDAGPLPEPDPVESPASDFEEVLPTSDEEFMSASDVGDVLSESDAENVLSASDAEHFNPSTNRALSDVGPLPADAEESLPASDFEEVLPTSDDEDGSPTSDAEGVCSESDTGNVLSASDAEHFVPSTNKALSEGESENSVADSSPSTHIKEETIDDESGAPDAEHPTETSVQELENTVAEQLPSSYVKEESISASDAEPSTDVIFDDYLEESTYYLPLDIKEESTYPPVDIKEESLASDEELSLPSISKGITGVPEKANLRGNEDAQKRGLLGEDILCGADETGGWNKINLQSVLQIRQTKSGGKRARKPRKTKIFIPPAPYRGPRHFDGRLLHCYYCKISRKYKSRLAEHMALHFPPEHHCSKCDKSFHTAHTLKKHMVSHSENPYECHLCAFTTKYSRSIKNHFAWHMKKLAMTSEPDTKTNVFSHTVPSKALLREAIAKNQVAHDGHLMLTNKAKWETMSKASKKLPPPYTGPRQPGDEYLHCYYCPEACNVKTTLEAHMYKHLPPQHFRKICSFGFSNSNYYRKHKKLAHCSKRTFKCRLCDFSAKWDSTLVNHVGRVHAQALETTSEMKRSTCYHCGWTTDYKFKLTRHMKVTKHQCETSKSQTLTALQSAQRPRKDPLPLDCSLCDYKGTSRPTLRTHIYLKHSEKRLECELCDFQTKHYNSLKMHKMWHNNERPYACPHCDYRAVQKAKLKTHIEKHAGKTLHECHMCDFRCLSASSLGKHVLCHSDAPNLECPACPFLTFQINSFAGHLKKHFNAEPASISEHNDEKPYVCQLCNHAAETIILLYEHTKTHRTSGTFKCPHCPYATVNQCILNKHINARHTKEVLHTCELCGFKTAYKSSLKDHINSVHTRSIWFKCRYCNFKALVKRGMAEHERRHRGDKRYSCELCGYRSITSTRMKKHKLTHTGKRPFACELCEFRGYDKKVIERHKQGVHSTERPFKCTFCSESFKTKQTAKWHELCHTGKKVYQCSECTWQTVKHCSLRNHMSEMHPADQEHKKLPDRFPSGRKKTWYRCNKCAFAVTGKPSLVRHVNLRHPIISHKSVPRSSSLKTYEL